MLQASRFDGSSILDPAPAPPALQAPSHSCIDLRKAITKLSPLVLTSAREVCDILALQAMRPPPARLEAMDLVVHHLRHTPEHRVITTLEKILAGHPDDALICREVNYFQNHHDHLNYADLAARSAPIGSGSMESFCSQFQDRLKRRGQFWSPRGRANLLVIDFVHKNNTLPFLWN